MDRMSDWITTGERPTPLYVTPFAKSASGGNSSKGDDPDDDDDDEEDDEDEDEDEDEDDDDPDDDLADMTDEELREALKEERAKVTRASERAARRRKREKKAREEAASKKPTPKPKPKGSSDDDEDLDTARERARAEGESAGIVRAKKAEAKSALLAAGVNSARVARAVGLLNLDELDLDDEGLDGIDEAIDDLKKEWPELFAKARRRRGSVAGEGDRGGEKGGRRKEMTPSERQAAAATRSGRR